MDENQRVRRSLGDQICPHNRLSKRRRGTEYALIMSEDLPDGLLLFRSQLSPKGNVDSFACRSFILRVYADTMGFENGQHVVDTSAGKTDVLGEALAAGYDPRLTIGR